jgi:ribosomal protein S18 acetylase RimI-like enzyme
MNIQIRSYEPTSDREALYPLWEAALDDAWPLYLEGFYATIDPQAEQHLVAVSEGELCGFVAISRDGPVNGSIFAIVAHPTHRDAGIEGILLEAATQHLRSLGATRLRFGCAKTYFWPGVPVDQLQTIQLLEQNRWHVGGRIADMVGDLETISVPQEITDRIARSHANLQLATPQDSPAILQFEELHFPQWRRTASRTVKRGDVADILLAELEGEIVGTNFLTPPGDPAFLWSRMLGKDCAAFGCLGVREADRGRYIGYALAVKAAEILQVRGARKIFLGWVFSTEWYGRLGYQVWKEYQAMDKKLS